MMLAVAPRRGRGVERHLPAAFRGLAGDLRQMPAGAPGKVGRLELRFERRGARTRLVHQHCSGPQRVNRVLYIDDALVDMAFVFIQSVGGGILQGDRLGVDISVGPRARAHVTTQSAVKLYRMEADYATQRVRASVEEGGCLEMLNEPLIPYRGARFHNEVELTTAQDATVIYADSITAGRVAHGESFAYELIHSRLVARYADGRPRAADTMVLAPGSQDPRSPGVLGGYSALGSMLVLSAAVPGARLATGMRASLGGDAGWWGSCSSLAHGDGAFVRLLAGSSTGVQAGLHAAWQEARQQLLGADVPRTHRVKYGFDLPSPNEGGGGSGRP